MTKQMAEEYYVRSEEGFCWGIFFIDESRGVLSYVTDHGNGGYVWKNHGRKSLKHFLVETNESYLLGKLFGAPDHIDWDDTHKMWLEVTKEDYEEGEITLAERNRIEEDIEDLVNYCLTADQLYVELTTNFDTLLNYNLFADMCDCPITYTYGGEAKGFFKKIWPRFTKQLKGEIDAEVTEKSR